jgi:hypothetical protein
MNGLPQHDVRRLRFMRLGALALAWLLPVINAYLHYPDVIRAILTETGLQVARA